MDIKELNKKQLVLLTLLITFVVSIATGIVTVSLMNQMPKTVPQTINNVIQRTIERVKTVEVQTPAKDNGTTKDITNSEDNLPSFFSNNSEALVSIFPKDIKVQDNISTSASSTNENINSATNEPVPIGQGVIISDIGLILVDSSILTENVLYKVILDKTDFDASILKKFNNGFTILKISAITDNATTKNTTKDITENTNTGNTSQ